jgi:hypothetical protein
LPIDGLRRWEGFPSRLGSAIAHALERLAFGYQ